MEEYRHGHRRAEFRADMAAYHPARSSSTRGRQGAWPAEVCQSGRLHRQQKMLAVLIDAFGTPQPSPVFLAPSIIVPYHGMGCLERQEALRSIGS